MTTNQVQRFNYLDSTVTDDGKRDTEIRLLQSLSPNVNINELSDEEAIKKKE